jgi:predicted nucleotidyltransferase
MARPDDILKRIKYSVPSSEPEAKIILYGSFARGDNRKDSDMDIIILLEKDQVSREDEKKVKYPLYDIEFDSGQVISPLVFSRKDWETRHKVTPFYQNVISEGIEL